MSKLRRDFSPRVFCLSSWPYLVMLDKAGLCSPLRREEHLSVATQGNKPEKDPRGRSGTHEGQ